MLLVPVQAVLSQFCEVRSLQCKMSNQTRLPIMKRTRSARLAEPAGKKIKLDQGGKSKHVVVCSSQAKYKAFLRVSVLRSMMDRLRQIMKGGMFCFCH